MIRYKWQVYYSYPVYRDGKIIYTTAKKYNFRFWIVAKGLDLVLSLFCHIKGGYPHSVDFGWINKYHIDNKELGIDYADEGPWRSYHITAYGDTLQDLLDDASISEVDQDGGDLACYGLNDADDEVYIQATNLLNKLVEYTNRNKVFK